MSLEKFSNRIGYLMKCEEISKRALSVRTNVQRKSIINWVSGKFYPRYDSMVKIADFFNVSTDYLLGIDEESLGEKFKKHKKEEIPKIFLTNLLDVQHAEALWLMQEKHRETVKGIMLVVSIGALVNLIAQCTT